MGKILFLNKKQLHAFVFSVVVSLLILLSYATSRYLLIFPFLTSCLYILFVKDDEQATHHFITMIFFAGTLMLSSGQTSLFFFTKIVFLVRHFLKKVKINKSLNKIFICLITFTATSIVNGLLLNTDSTKRIINLALWFSVAVVLLFKYRNCKDGLLNIFLISFLYSSIFAALGVFVPSLASEIKNVDIYYDPGYSNNISRYTGIFGDPNITTIAICLSLFITLYLYKNGKYSPSRFLLYSGFLSLLGILTGSKSCFLLLIVYWATYFMTYSKNKSIKILLFSAALILLFSFSSTSLYDYYYYRFFGAASGITTGRTDIWVTYVDALNSKGLSGWLFGFGMNTVYLPNGRAAHNFILQIIYNIGIFGLIIYLMLWMAIIFAYCGINKTKIKISNLIPFFAMISTAMFLDSFFIEFYYYIFAFSIMLIPQSNNKVYLYQKKGENEYGKNTIGNCSVV